MFIRKTTTRRKKDGSSYTTHRLVESNRVGDRVRQRTLLHLAADFSIPQDLWPALTHRVEEILHHQDHVFAGNVSEPVTLKEMVETLSEGITKRLIVMDAGLATKENLAWLEARGCAYLTVHRHPAEAWEAERVEGHLWITLLAYHLVHVLRVRLKEQGIHDSWKTLRRRIRGHMRVTTSFRTQEGRPFTSGRRPVPRRGSSRSTPPWDSPPTREGRARRSWESVTGGDEDGLRVHSRLDTASLLTYLG